MIALILFVFMQVAPQPVPAPAPAPAPVQLSVSQLPAPAEYSTYLYDVAGLTVVKAATGGVELASSIWALPDFLISSRDPKNIIEQPDAAQLNQHLVELVAGLSIVAMLLMLGYQGATVLRGETINPMVSLGLITIVGLAGLAAVNNQALMYFPVELANLILSTISGAPIEQFVQPVFHVADAGDMLWNGILLFFLVLVVLGLTVVLFIEAAWCLVLGVLVGLCLFGLPLPIFGGGCKFLIGRWLGSLFSPMVALTAIRLAAPSTATFVFGGVPTQGVQLLTIALLFVAWQAPGLMVAAIAVSFPSARGIYYAGRLVGFGRVSERMIGNAGSGGTRGNPPRTRSGPPQRVSGGLGTGGGGAAGGHWMPVSP